MKGQLMMCLLAIGFGCQEQPLTTDSVEDEKWTISWEFDNKVTYGSIQFYENQLARIVVEQPDALFFNQPEDVVFNWSIKDSTFHFTRTDNNFAIGYQIISQRDNYYELGLNDDLIVKIYR